MTEYELSQRVMESWQTLSDTVFRWSLVTLATLAIVRFGEGLKPAQRYVVAGIYTTLSLHFALSYYLALRALFYFRERLAMERAENEIPNLLPVTAGFLDFFVGAALLVFGSGATLYLTLTARARQPQATTTEPGV